MGTSLETWGPGDSARMMNKLSPLVPEGERASRNTRTPMPPSQWLKERQYRIPLGSGSRSLRMLAPVVVKPLAASNRASIKLGMQPLMTKGAAPAMDTRNQHRPVMI